MGDLDVGPVLAALEEIEFSGWVSVEAFDATYGIERIAHESMENLQRSVKAEG